MAHITSTTFPRAPFWATLGTAFVNWLEKTMNNYARTDQIDALKALSDEELAAKGLTRDRIALYVYRDRIVL